MVQEEVTQAVPDGVVGEPAPCTRAPTASAGAAPSKVVPTSVAFVVQSKCIMSWYIEYEALLRCQDGPAATASKGRARKAPSRPGSPAATAAGQADAQA